MLNAERVEQEAQRTRFEAIRRVFPHPSQAEICVAGGFARFFGPLSPLNTDGWMGTAGPVSADDVERVVAFFRERGGPIRAISTVSSHPSLAERLDARGFVRIETQNVLLGDLRDMTGALDPRVARATDLRAWGRAGAEVYADGDAPPPDIDVTGDVVASTSSVVPLEIRIDGSIAAVAALDVCGDMGSLIFGNTLAWARGRGLQSALIRHRIALLQDAGVAQVRAMTSAGSSSERNALRAGLKIAFARTLWELPLEG